MHSLVTVYHVFLMIGSYDCVMVHGVVYPGQIEVEGIAELIRIVKPGSYATNLLAK